MAADVSTGLPQLDLRDGSILTVDSGDAAVPITKLVVHGWQESGAAETVPALPPLLSIMQTGSV